MEEELPTCKGLLLRVQDSLKVCFGASYGHITAILNPGTLLVLISSPPDSLGSGIWEFWDVSGFWEEARVLGLRVQAGC